MASQAPLPFIDPGQGILEGMGPNVGERWRNRNTQNIVAVTGIRQGRYQWVRMRTIAGEAEITTARFLEVFERV